LPQAVIDKIYEVVHEKDASLEMFGIDVIRDSETGIYHIVDLNFAPSYAEVVSGSSLVLNHILTKISERFTRPFKNAEKLPNLNDINRDNSIVVLDIDGTITEDGRVITDEVKSILNNLKKITNIGVISGGTIQQVGSRLGQNYLNDYDYVFSENSCQTYFHSELVDPLEMESLLTRKEITELINWSLIYIANLELPLKRGLFIDYRSGLINISPAGRISNENIKARYEWIDFDRKNNIRKKMVEDMKSKFESWNKLSWVIGGNSGFDVFPKGWDKSLVHRFTKKYKYYFYFGDKTNPELFGNDYPCYSHETSFGFSVKDPDDTVKILKALFNV